MIHKCDGQTDRQTSS